MRTRIVLWEETKRESVRPNNKSKKKEKEVIKYYVLEYFNEKKSVANEQ